MKDLLGGSFKNPGIRAQILVAQTLTAANAILAECFGVGDCKAIVIRHQTLTIACLHSSIAFLVNARSEDLLNRIKERVPQTDLMQVRTKVVDVFPSSEPGT